MADIKIHPFEKAGLGQAPFRLLSVTKNLFTVPGVPEATKPGSSCDFCATGITYEYWCQGSGPEDRKFKVGCDCVAKTNRQDKFSSDVERAAHRLKAQVRKDSETLRIAQAKAKLAGPEGEEIKFALRTHPHPARYQAEQGKTLWSYVQFLLARGGHTGQLKAVRLIKKTKRATDEEITKYRQLRNGWEAEAKQAQAKATLEVDRRKAIALSATNQWVIQELGEYGQWDQFGDPRNFAASIVTDLKNGQPVADLPSKAKNIIADILSKGYRGRAKDQRFETVWDYLEPSDPRCSRCGVAYQSSQRYSGKGLCGNCGYESHCESAEAAHQERYG